MSTRSTVVEAARPSRDPAWHDVENGGYGADLALWEQLAGEAAGPVLELGAGTGRVALRLAAAGAEVTALDNSATLLGELARRAADAGLAVETCRCDALELAHDRRFALVIAPMQFAHLFDRDGRGRLLERAAGALLPGGAIALAILADGAAAQSLSATSAPLMPDVRERAGWVYSSLPVDVAHDGDALVVRRLRQLVSPTGEFSESVDVVRLEDLSAAELEAEAARCGLESRERLEIPATADHVGSTVVVVEAPR